MDCSTSLCGWDRFTGMPPSHWKKPLKGLRNMASFPIQCILARKAKAVNSVKGKSQFEVCGAPSRTNFGIGGSWPSVRQPARLKTKREARCKTAPSTGVLNMVWFTISAFFSKQCLHTDWHQYIHSNHCSATKQSCNPWITHPERNRSQRAPLWAGSP